MPALLVLKYIPTNIQAKKQNKNTKSKSKTKKIILKILQGRFHWPTAKEITEKKNSSHSFNSIAIMINDSKTPFKHDFLGFSSLWDPA